MPTHSFRTARTRLTLILYCLQRISHEFGWSYRDVVDRLEEKRKVKAAAFHERKVATQKAQVAALKAATNAAPITEKLASYGY